MTPRSDPHATAWSAVVNASRVPFDRAMIAVLLAGGDGDVAQLRALFGDVALDTLLRLADRHGIAEATLARAYLRARARHGAANPEVEDWLSAEH
jgi:hypothetical protein